jgi:hypothetical protein
MILDVVGHEELLSFVVVVACTTGMRGIEARSTRGSAHVIRLSSGNGIISDIK